MPEGRDVARRVNIGHRCLAKRVHQNAAIDRHAGRSGQLDIALHANAGHHQIGDEAVATAAEHADRAVGCCVDGVHRHVKMQLCSGFPMQPGDEIGDFRRDAAAHRRRASLDHGYVEAGPASRRGDLKADHAGADADHAARVGKVFAQPASVFDRAQRQRVLAARHRHGARLASGREQQFVVSHGGAVIQPNTLPDRVDRQRGSAANELDPQLGVTAFGVKILDRRLVWGGQPRFR